MFRKDKKVTPDANFKLWSRKCSVNYRPQTKLWKGNVFTSVSRILSTGGGVCQTPLGRPPLDRLGRHPPGQTRQPPPGQPKHTPLDRLGRHPHSLGRHPPDRLGKHPLPPGQPRQTPPGQTTSLGRPPPPGSHHRPLQRTVCILLECILVYHISLVLQY